MKENASNHRAWQARLALMVIFGVTAAVACLVTLMLWKTSASSAQVVASSGLEFVTRCNFSHRNSDDPIVFPGKPGEAHSHDFFGNGSTDFASTLESLQAFNGPTGTESGTTCFNPDDKSAYWIPTTSWTTQKSGTRELTPSTALFYYRASGKGDVQPPPAGLKVVPNTHVKWRCAGDTAVTPSPPKRCSSGALFVIIRFPDCVAEDSNEQLLTDSDNHRRHMAYAVTQTDGTRQCPDTHPNPVATLFMEVKFQIGTHPGTVTLSSDHQGAPPASTMHADFFNAWDQEKLSTLVERCINAYPFTPENPKPTDCRQV